MVQNRQMEFNVKFSLFSLIRRALGVLIILILAYFLYQANSALTERETLNTSLKEELEVWKGKDGLNRARISTLETQRVSDFLDLATKDSAVLALQSDVKKMQKYLKKVGASVTNFTGSTSIDTSVPTTIIDNGTPFPTYKSDFNLDGWVTGKSVATKDSTFLSLKVKNEYSITLGSEPTGFLGLGKRKPFAQVTNKNPFSETESLRTYKVNTGKTKRFSVGPVAAYGLNLGPVPQLGGFIGVGVNYSLIKF